jgi:hypothetical protein
MKLRLLRDIFWLVTPTSVIPYESLARVASIQLWCLCCPAARREREVKSTRRWRQPRYSDSATRILHQGPKPIVESAKSKDPQMAQLRVTFVTRRLIRSARIIPRYNSRLDNTFVLKHSKILNTILSNGNVSPLDPLHEIFSSCPSTTPPLASAARGHHIHKS